VLDHNARSAGAFLVLLLWSAVAAADMVWQQVKVDATLGHLIMGERKQWRGGGGQLVLPGSSGRVVSVRSERLYSRAATRGVLLGCRVDGRSRRGSKGLKQPLHAS
jgi:hypothetical protein